MRRLHTLLGLGLRLIILAVFMFSGLGLISGCLNSEKKIVTPHDPAATAQMFLMALANSDWQTAYYLVDQKTKATLQQNNISSKQWGKLMLSQMDPGFQKHMADFEVTTTKTDGDRATVTMLNKTNGKSRQVEMVREHGEWKFAATKRKVFATPEAAFREFLSVMKNGDAAGLLNLFSNDVASGVKSEGELQDYVNQLRQAGLTPEVVDSIEYLRTEVNGNSAKVYWKEQGVEREPVTFVLEDGWRLSD